MVGYRSDHQQDIGLAWRRRDKKSQSVHIVIGIIEEFDLVETGATATGIYHADMERTPESLRKGRVIQLQSPPIQIRIPKQPEWPYPAHNDSNGHMRTVDDQLPVSLTQGSGRADSPLIPERIYHHKSPPWGNPGEIPGE